MSVMCNGSSERQDFASGQMLQKGYVLLTSLDGCIIDLVKKASILLSEKNEKVTKMKTSTAFQGKLIGILKTDSRFIDQDGELVKAAIIDRA